MYINIDCVSESFCKSYTYMLRVQVMATINLQCNSLSQVFSQAENSMTGRAYVGDGSADISVNEIH